MAKLIIWRFDAVFVSFFCVPSTSGGVILMSAVSSDDRRKEVLWWKGDEDGFVECVLFTVARLGFRANPWTGSSNTRLANFIF